MDEHSAAATTIINNVTPHCSRYRRTKAAKHLPRYRVTALGRRRDATEVFSLKRGSAVEQQQEPSGSRCSLHGMSVGRL